MRRVCYVSGTRADFGLIRRTLRLAQASGRLEVCVCVTGMHLSPAFGQTARDVEASGLRICARIPVALEACTGAAMAVALGQELLEMTALFERQRSDLVMVLGDRGEMLAGALAALHLNIPVVHVHGGERSGTVDEPIRHAISKLAHYHFVATPGARGRLIHMGERPEHVFVTGAPGLDGLRELGQKDRAALCRDLDLDPERPVALVIYHPVLQEADRAGTQAEAVLQAVLAARLQALCFLPNADAGGRLIRSVLERYRDDRRVRLISHLPRPDFVSSLAAADVMVGNSSSGIIEAATFGLPVVNVGTRQRDRERSGNVLDVPEADAGKIRAAIAASLGRPRPVVPNVYGDGQAGQRIVELLATLPIGESVLAKSNAY